MSALVTKDADLSQLDGPDDGGYIMCGSRVELLGLTDKKMNKKQGRVMKWDKAEKRWGVRIDGDTKIIAIQPENLMSLAPPVAKKRFSETECSYKPNSMANMIAKAMGGPDVEKNMLHVIGGDEKNSMEVLTAMGHIPGGMDSSHIQSTTISTGGLPGMDVCSNNNAMIGL